MNKKLMRSFVFVGLMALIVCGNFLTALAVETYTWEEKASMIEGRKGHESVTSGDKIYAIGGHTLASLYSNTMEVYDIQSNTWESKANMIYGRRNFAASFYNGKIYVFGGITENDLYSNTVEVYDIANNTWELKTNMHDSRSRCKSVVIGNKIYLIGGSMQNIEVYDPATDTWDIKSQIPHTRVLFGVTKLDNKIYSLGGRYAASLVQSDSVDIYDTVNDTWNTAMNLPSPRFEFMSFDFGGKIYALFGSNDDSGFMNSVLVYNPNTNLWSTATDYPLGKLSLYRYAKIDNKIYVVGGSVAPNTYSDKLMVLTIQQSIPSSPTNLTATLGNTQVLLNWDQLTEADTYTVKRSTTQGGPYTTIAENITETSYLDTSVVNGTTYYYVVTAVNTAGESDPSNEASATPIAPIVNRALLNITMQESLIKEYDLSMNQVNSFIDWYNSSTGSELYTVEKFANIGPFISRKDYLVKGKIVCFEVMEYVN